MTKLPAVERLPAVKRQVMATWPHCAEFLVFRHVFDLGSDIGQLLASRSSDLECHSVSGLGPWWFCIAAAVILTTYKNDAFNLVLSADHSVAPVTESRLHRHVLAHVEPTHYLAFISSVVTLLYCLLIG
ncbi:uncharacterized protein LOC144807804 [Lissotriton helveticus]